MIPESSPPQLWHFVGVVLVPCKCKSQSVTGHADLSLPAQHPGISLLSGLLACRMAFLIISNFGEGRTEDTTISIV